MEWIHKYEIGKMIDAALSDGNGDHRPALVFQIRDAERSCCTRLSLAFMSITATVEHMTVYVCRSILEKRNFSFHR